MKTQKIIRLDGILTKGFKGVVIGTHKHGYITEYKLRLTETNGNYKKGTIVYI